jgi:GT2 family glycosyltransferase
LSNPEVTFVVPSLGTSPYLRDCVGSAAASQDVHAEIVLVHPRSVTPGLDSIPGLRSVTTRREVGFSEACNLGISASRGEYVALLNDEAILESDWARRLISALREVPCAAAAQGVNLVMARPDRMDGRGLQWNQKWQAVQIGHGDPAPPAGGPIEEVFGVSATAAVYRRGALEAVSLPNSEVFDPRLESYYEDVELACRLREAGYTALSVPAARALHAGATTTSGRALHRFRLIYGNRYLVLARFRGKAFWGDLPTLLGRDLLDLGQAAIDLDHRKLLGILDGWVRAIRHLALFLNSEEPRVSTERRKDSEKA